MSMLCDRVLCPTDLKTSDDPAIAVAYRLARPGGVVRLFHVYEPPVLPNPLVDSITGAVPPDAGAVAAAGRAVRTRIEALIPRHASALGVRTEISALCDASVAGRVLDEVGRFDGDAIVMGTRGNSSVVRALLGSVATAVIRDAKVPVVVVHRPLD